MKTPAAFHIRLDRRRLLQSLLLTTGGLFSEAAYAEALTLTPSMTEGPYYPDHLPLDQDNDLVQMAGNKAEALGTVVEFGGRLLNADGKPLGAHQVELWQADNNGCYIHTRGVQRGRERDMRFQGYGKIETNGRGEYRFRTIKPGLYTGRTLHWHIAINKGGKRLLTTQLFMAGVPQNESDGLLKGIKDPARKLSVIRDFKPKTEGMTALVGAWDIILGTTPGESEMGQPPTPQRNNGAPP